MTSQSDTSTAPSAMIASLWRNRYLAWQLTRRDLISRYQGSIVGVAWSFVQPLLMLVVYTIVFSVVFKPQWQGVPAGSTAGFAAILFSGLIVHTFVSECFVRAPSIILAYTNYVKKIVFPLEILPWTIMGSALFHAFVSVVVLVVAQVFLTGELQIRCLWFPVVLLPLIVGMMGVSWLLSSLGVFIRDIAQAVQPISTVLLFLSPIFYPVSAVPEAYRPWINFNPLTYFVEEARNVLIWNQSPDWGKWAVSAVIGSLVAWAGFWWFQRTRRGFADVL
jgi:lipopolysaccharide transport system permease protein